MPKRTQAALQSTVIRHSYWQA